MCERQTALIAILSVLIIKPVKFPKVDVKQEKEEGWYHLVRVLILHSQRLGGSLGISRNPEPVLHIN